MAKGKVLVLGSNATRIEVRNGGTGATGQYLNETVVPAQALIAAGYDVVLATPDGSGGHALWANATWDSFRAKWDEWSRQGLRLHDVHVVNVGGQDRWTGAFLAGSGGQLGQARA